MPGRSATTHTTVCHLLRARAEVHGDRPLFRFEGREVSYRQVEQDSNRLARVLADLGVRRGDRVAIMLPNGLDFPLAWFAVAKTGAIGVPVNIQLREADLGYILRHSGASHALAGSAQVAMLASVHGSCPELKVVSAFGDGAATPGCVNLESRIRAAASEWNIDSLDAHDPVVVQYTSGTTGMPKGCLLHHRYWLRMAEGIQRHVALGPDDTVLTAQPFSYMDPIWNMIMCVLAGARLVILPRFSASTFWRSVKENDVTFFYCIGTMPIYLHAQPPDPATERGHRVRLVYCSAIPPALHAAFEQRWGCAWREAYGSTELGAVLIVPPTDSASVGSGSLGEPLPRYEVRVVGPDGRDVADGGPGELVVRGEDTMLGYFRDADATAAWMEGGWAHTGDVAIRDTGGRFRLVGRLKDMIRRAGENIAAAEVESVLMEHPDVLAAACVPVPDAMRGEEVKAFVQLRPGRSPASVTPSDLLAFAGGRLADFKVPRFVEYVAEFPLTPSAKIAKAVLLAARPDQRSGAYDAVAGRWGDDA